MFLHGVVWVHLFALQHECVHYTAFRTRSLNEFFGNFCGFAIMLPNRFFRYEHCDHHTYTQLHGKDPELIELPISLGKYLSFVSSLPFWTQRFREFGWHILGRFSEAEKKFIPREDRASVIVEARGHGIGLCGNPGVECGFRRLGPCSGTGGCPCSWVNR